MGRRNIILGVSIMNRQTLRKLILLLSFTIFPITVIYLAPAPPIMSLKEGVVNLSVIVIASVFLSGLFLRRAFCGWLCPFGALQELLNEGARRIGIRQIHVPWALHERLWPI